MTTLTLFVVALALLVSAVAAVGAAVIWRALSGAGRSLRQLDERLSGQALVVPQKMADARQQLIGVRADAERVLWTVANLDERIDVARRDLAARRGASDTLRMRMISSHATLARIRETTRLLIRAIELRREFLG